MRPCAAMRVLPSGVYPRGLSRNAFPMDRHESGSRDGLDGTCFSPRRGAAQRQADSEKGGEKGRVWQWGGGKTCREPELKGKGLVAGPQKPGVKREQPPRKAGANAQQRRVHCLRPPSVPRHPWRVPKGPRGYRSGSRAGSCEQSRTHLERRK